MVELVNNYYALVFCVVGKGFEKLNTDYDDYDNDDPIDDLKMAARFIDKEIDASLEAMGFHFEKRAPLFPVQDVVFDDCAVYTKDAGELAYEFRELKMGWSTIGALLDISYTTAMSYAKRYAKETGRPMPVIRKKHNGAHRFTPDDAAEMYRLKRDENMTLEQIAREFNADASTISRQIRKHHKAISVAI